MAKRYTIQDINALRDLSEKGDVAGYWTYQADKGSALGALSLNAATNQGMDGCVANEFLKLRAAKAGRPLTPQGLDELRLGFMRGDFGAQNTAFLSGAADGGAELGARTVHGYHSNVLKKKGYSTELWTPEYLIGDDLAKGNDAAADRQLKYISESGFGKYPFLGLGVHGLAMGDPEAGIPGDVKAAEWLADTSRAAVTCMMPGARKNDPISNAPPAPDGEGAAARREEQTVPYTPIDEDEKPKPWQLVAPVPLSGHMLPEEVTEDDLRAQRRKAMQLLLDP